MSKKSVRCEQLDGGVVRLTYGEGTAASRVSYGEGEREQAVRDLRAFFGLVPPPAEVPET